MDWFATTMVIAGILQLRASWSKSFLTWLLNLGVSIP